MKEFALRLLLFGIIFFIYDKAFIIIESRSAEAEIDKRLEYLINGEINKDIIITGSSRGSRGIIAGRIEDKTGLSAYNLCYPGSDVEFHEFILRTLVTFNELPQIVVLVVDDYSEFIEDEKITFRKDRLYPLVKYPYIRQELVDIGEKDKFMSKVLILQQLNKANFALKQKIFTPKDTILDCGSMPISWQREGREWKYISDERKYPAEKEVIDKICAYENIVNLCKTENIHLVIVFPPNFQTPSKSFENRIKELTSDEFYYLYDTENPIYRDKDYFYDEEHLKRNGAVIFTDEMILFLNDSLLNHIKLHNY